MQFSIDFFSLLKSIASLYLYMPEFNLLCQPPNLSNTVNGRKEALGTYFYYILKILDLVDTVFFVLRKKTTQISFLHVYHHGALLLGTYVIFSWRPGKLNRLNLILKLIANNILLLNCQAVFSWC